MEGTNGDVSYPGALNAAILIYNNVNFIKERRSSSFQGTTSFPRSPHTLAITSNLREIPSGTSSFLNLVKELPSKTVLPGHEWIFHDLAGWVSTLQAHHENRCGKIIGKVKEEAKTVFEVSSIVSWDSRSWNEMAFWTRG